MNVVSRFMLTIGASAASLTTSLVLSTPVVQAQATSRIAGTWTGQFGPSQWVFEFTRSGESWSGRYMDAKYQKWHDVENLKISGNAVSFSIVSNPQLIFSLAVDERGETLSGRGSTPTMPPGVGIPFSGTRKPA